MYRTIHSDIVQQILSGAWSPGYRIPSEVDLAAQYSCSRMTVNKALSQLAAEGYIERRRRAGSVVAQPVVQSAVLDIHGIEDEVGTLGLPYRYTLLSRTERAIEPGRDDHFDGQTGEMLDIAALHLADGLPFCLEERRISLVTVPEARFGDFGDTAPGAWLLARVPWNQATHEIRAVAASDLAASALDIPKGTPCLVIERRTWNTSGSITQVRFTYQGTRHAVTAQFAPLGPQPVQGAES
jgi:GntR family histidine utilization transcriptional repressor